MASVPPNNPNQKKKPHTYSQRKQPSQAQGRLPVAPPAYQATAMTPFSYADEEFPTLGAAVSQPAKAKSLSSTKTEAKRPSADDSASSAHSQFSTFIEHDERDANIPPPNAIPKTVTRLYRNKNLSQPVAIQFNPTTQNNSPATYERPLNARETEINEKLCEIILILHKSGKYVSREKVQKELFKHFGVESWEELNTRPARYNVLMNLTDKQKGVTFYMQVFEHVFNLCTLHDLEPYLARFMKVESYADLRLGPIEQNPDIQRVFKYKPTNPDQPIPPITVTDFIKRFIEFQNKQKRNEQFSFELFLDELVEKYDLQSREELAIFCKSFPYVKQTINHVRRDLSAIIQQVRAQSQTEINDELHERLKELKDKLRESEQLSEFNEKKSPTAVFVYLFSIVEKYMDIIPEQPAVYTFLAQIRENDLLRCLFNISIYLGTLDKPEEYVAELKKIYEGREKKALDSATTEQMIASAKTLDKKHRKKMIELVQHQQQLASQTGALDFELGEQTTTASAPISTSFVSTLLASQTDTSKPPISLKQLCSDIYSLLVRYDSILTIEQLNEIDAEICNRNGVPDFSVFNYPENNNDQSPINFVSFLQIHRDQIDPNGELSIYDEKASTNDQSELYSFVNQLNAIHENATHEEHQATSISMTHGHLNIDQVHLSKEKLSALEKAIKHKFGGSSNSRKGNQLVKKAKDRRSRKHKFVVTNFEEALLDVHGLNRLDTCPTTLNVDEAQLCQLILHCPLMFDLPTWLQWPSFFQPKYGTLKSFIDKNDYRLKDLRLLETSDQQLFRLPLDTSLGIFEKELKSMQIRSAVGHLCALIVQEGLITRFSFNVYRTSMTTWFHQLQALKLSQDEPIDPLQYVLDFLMYLPGIIGQSKVVEELVLRPLNDVFGNDLTDGVNPRMRIWSLADMKQKTKLELWGHTGNVNEWINEKKWSGSSEEVIDTPSGKVENKSVTEKQNLNTLATSVEPTTPITEMRPVSTPDVTSFTPVLTTMSSKDDSDSSQTAFEHIQSIRRGFGIDSGLDPIGQSVVNNYQGMLDRSLKELSTDLYSEQIHFVLELVQNADDNQYILNRLPTLRFILSHERILVCNNEIGFQPDNIAAICNVGASTKGQHKQGYAGHKGIGFKSVFMVSSRPEVHSRNYHIRFDVTNKDDRIGYVRPIWIDQYEEELPNREKWTTCIRLPFKNDIPRDRLQQGFEGIQARLLLFLNRLRQIEIIDEQNTNSGSKTRRIFTRIDHANGQIIQLQEKIGDQPTADNFWLVVKRVIKVPEEIKEKLHDIKGNIDSTTISIAYPLNGLQEASTQIPPIQPLFAYLPLRPFGFRFILQADFEIPANRQDIRRDNIWNDWLKNSEMTRLLSLAYQQFQSLPDLLASSSINTQINTHLTPIQTIKYFLKLLPSKIELDPYFRTFIDESMKLLMGIIKLPISRENEQQEKIIDWISPSQCVIIKDSYIRKILSPNLLLTHFNSYYVHEELADECDEQILLKLGCRQLDFKDITQLIEASYKQNEQQHAKTTSSIEQIAEWLLCLDYSLQQARNEGHNSSYEKEIITKLKQLKIIPLKQQNHFVSIDQFDKHSILFPLDSKKNKFSQHLKFVLEDIPTLDEQLLNYIEDKYPRQFDSIKRLLKNLGISEGLNIREIYRQHILPVMKEATRWPTKSESVLVSYLLCIYEFIFLPYRTEFENDLKDVQKIMIVKTRDNQFVSLGSSDVIVHLSSIYSNRLSLDTLKLSKHKFMFLSDDYYRLFRQNISQRESDVYEFLSFLKILRIDDFLQIESIENPFAQVSQLVDTPWSYMINALSEMVYEPFYIFDYRSDEFNKLLSSSDDMDTELCIQLLQYLDRNHQIVSRNYAATVVLARLHKFGQGTPIKSIKSSFAFSLQQHAWIPVVGDQLFKPTDVYFFPRNSGTAAFRRYVPHLDVSKIVLNDPDFAYNILGLKSDITHQTMFEFLMKWSCDLNSESLWNLINQTNPTDPIPCTLSDTFHRTCDDNLDNFRQIYRFLASDEETRALLYRFRLWPLIFIPKDQQTGEFIYTRQTFWSDPLSLLSSENSKDRIPIAPYYNAPSGLQQFFEEILQVEPQPTIDDYLPLLTSTDDTNKLWEIIKIATQLAIEQNKQKEMLNKCRDIAFIPCLNEKKQLVKYTDNPIYPHNLEIGNLFADVLSIIKLPDFDLSPKIKKDFCTLFYINSLDKIIQTKAKVTNEQPSISLANFYRSSIDLIQHFLLSKNFISNTRSADLATVFSRMKFVCVDSLRLSYSYLTDIIRELPKSANTDAYIDEETYKFYILKKFEAAEMRYTDAMANFVVENEGNRSDVANYIKKLLQEYQNDETEGLTKIRDSLTENYEPKWTIPEEIKKEIPIVIPLVETKDELPEKLPEISADERQQIMNEPSRRPKLPPRVVNKDEPVLITSFPVTAGIIETVTPKPKDPSKSKIEEAFKNDQTVSSSGTNIDEQDDHVQIVPKERNIDSTDENISKNKTYDNERRLHRDHFDQPPVPVTFSDETLSPIATFKHIAISTLSNVDLFSSTNTTNEPSINQLRPYGNETDLITGRLGEELVFRYLKHTHSNETVEWMNEKGESGRPYDISVLTKSENDQKEYIEVKTTRLSDQHTFPLSIGEVEYLLRHPSNYFIYRVYYAEPKELSTITVINHIKGNLQSKHLQLSMTVLS